MKVCVRTKYMHIISDYFKKSGVGEANVKILDCQRGEGAEEFP